MSLARRLSAVAALAAASLSGACAARPETGFLAPVAGIEAGAAAHTMLVATTRKRDERPGTFFGGERASPLDFARIEVSVPARLAAGVGVRPGTPMNRAGR